MADKFKHLPNTGTSFVNNKKDATNKQPDYNGTIYVEKPGEYYIATWKNEITGEDNKPALSHKLKPKV
jgi:hypothetical protein